MNKAVSRFLLSTILLSTTLALLGTVGLAQPLAQLAPADTVLSLSMRWQGGPVETLGDDLNALGWEQGKATLTKLVEAGRALDPDLKDMLEVYETMLTGPNDTDLPDELVEVCPGLQDLADASREYQGKKYSSDALLTLSLASFSPIPAGTALLRVDDDLAPLYEQVQSTLLECLKDSGDVEVTELEQGGVTFYVIGDASDFPVVAGNVGTLYFLGTNPETVRGVIRRAQGASEPNLADTPFYQQTNAKLAPTTDSLGFSLNAAALADTLQGVAGFLGTNPETDYLVTRTGALLRTLGGVAGTAALTDEGVRFENVLAVDPAGGDAALLKLILCQTCTVSEPFVAPRNSVGVAAQYLPWRELYAYAQDWVTGLEAVTGERVDLKQVVQETLGLDLDAALFDWLGSEVQTYTLESVGPNLRTLVYGQAAVSVVPVSSPEAARAGLEALGRTFGPILSELLTEAGGMGDMSSVENLFGTGDLLGETVVSDYTYKDVSVTRLRAGFNTDVGYTFVGNYLIFGAPRALEQVVDTYQGARSFIFDPVYRSLRAALPAQLSSFTYSDTADNLNGFADLLDVVVQPAAFGASTALTGLEEGVMSDDGYSDLGYADLYEVVPEPVNVPDTVEATLTEDDLDDYGAYAVYYELTDLAPGAEVTVSLTSDAVDASLSLIDADAETYLAEGEYGEDFYTSELTFTAEEGRRYFLEVTSYDITETGDYSLSVTAEEGQVETVEEVDADPLTDLELPTFAELLDLFDLLPQSLRVLADHTSTSERYTEVAGNEVYTRSLVRVRW